MSENVQPSKAIAESARYTLATVDPVELAEGIDYLRGILPTFREQFGDERGLAWFEANLFASEHWYQADAFLRWIIAAAVTRDPVIYTMSVEKFERFESMMAAIALGSGESFYVEPRKDTVN